MRVTISRTLECKLIYLYTGKSNEVGANTETCTSACGRANRGGIDVQHCEGGCGDETDHGDLSELESLAGEDKGSNRNCETLQYLLHNASDEITEVQTRGSRLGFGFHLFVEITGRFFNTLV